MKKYFFTSLFFLLITLAFLSGSQASAQSPSPDTLRGKSEEKRQEIQDKKQAHQENLCNRVQERITGRKNHYQDKRDRHINVYHGVVHRLNNLIDKLKNRGCDTSQVETDLTTLEALIDGLTTDFNLFLDQLHSVGIPVCQKQPGDWKAAMADVKAQLQITKDKQQEIRAFYKNTLKPHVKAAGQACKSKTSPTPTVSPEGDTNE